jgi:hypothetical protein
MVGTISFDVKAQSYSCMKAFAFRCGHHIRVIELLHDRNLMGEGASTDVYSSYMYVAMQKNFSQRQLEQIRSRWRQGMQIAEQNVRAGNGQVHRNWYELSSEEQSYFITSCTTGIAVDPEKLCQDFQ